MAGTGKRNWLLVHNTCYNDIIREYRRQGKFFNEPPLNSSRVTILRNDPFYKYIAKTKDGLYDVYFNKNGFPDFVHSGFTKGPEFAYDPGKQGYIDLVHNNNPITSSDFENANKWIREAFPGRVTGATGKKSNFRIDGEEYTWHHHEDGVTLIPVLKRVHQNIEHTGSVSLKTVGLIPNEFPGPY